MKKVFLFTVLFFAIASTFSQVYVSGYYKSNGTYVQPHYRSSPNSTVLDNYSTKGNINPYTGQIGTKSVSSNYSNYSTSSYSSNYYPSTTYSTPTYSTPTYSNTYSNFYDSPRYSSPTYSSTPIYTGPRGGTYYVNSNGNKTYVKNR